MPNYFYLTLDTTAPANTTLSLEGGAPFATNQLVTTAIGTTDGDTIGYMMLIYGDVDNTFDTNIKSTKATSSWITFNNSKQIKLSSGDENKTIYVKIRDDLNNISAQVADSITLNTSIPTVSVTNPDASKISKQAGENSSSFIFTVDKAFVECKVKIVGANGSAETSGSLVPSTNGSSNTSGTGSFVNGTPINVTIKGSDLEVASSGDGQKIVKVFAKDQAGLWSA